jgi:protoheme IX farnesyltransferase|tara:strand:- start:680 stop:1594 length:915 start_codon:yes stop_codon:yes gene_type:complete
LTVNTNTNELNQSLNIEGSPKDYFILMKPRVMSLVVFTAFVGYYAALSEGAYNLNPFLAAIGILAIAIGAGASGVLNQWYDRDIDKIMERTKDRPIPAGKIDPAEALAFGMITAAMSVIILGLSVNWLSAFLLAFTIIFYAVFYTVFLKRYTIQNIVIGGAAGAFPPVIGFTLVTGSLSLEPIILFGIIFLWTPPHFWALALTKQDDYRLANIPMLPVVSGEKITKKYILYYILALIPFSLLPFILGYSGYIYFITSIILGIELLRRTIYLLKSKHNAEQKLFFYSIFYLFFLFLGICIDKFLL